MSQSPEPQRAEPRRRYREHEGKTCIELTLKSVQQLFDSRDPAPFRERDLDDDAVQYIVSAADEIPFKNPIKLVIHLGDPAYPTQEHPLADAIHSFFDYEAELLRIRLKRTLKTGQTFLLLGIVTLMTFLGAAEFVSSMFAEGTFRAIAREGLVITGWVAMWRPIEVFLYDWWPLATQRRLYRKLAQVEIQVEQAKAALG